MISNSLKELKSNQKEVEREASAFIKNAQELRDREILKMKAAFDEICAQLMEYNEFLEGESLSINSRLFAYWGEPCDDSYEKNAYISFNTHPNSSWIRGEVGNVIKIQNYGYNGYTTIIIHKDGCIKASGFNLEATQIKIVRDWPTIKKFIESKIEEYLKRKISTTIEASKKVLEQAEYLHKINMQNNIPNRGFSEKDYVGKEIQLYPGDFDTKYGIIRKVDELGWTIEITKSNDPTLYKTGTTHFISHAKKFSFRFVDKIKGNSLKPVLV